MPISSSPGCPEMYELQNLINYICKNLELSYLEIFDNNDIFLLNMHISHEKLRKITSTCIILLQICLENKLVFFLNEGNITMILLAFFQYYKSNLKREYSIDK